MNWRVFLALAVVAGLALGSAPAFAQGPGSSNSGLASVSVTHNFIMDSYGFGVLSENFTFANNGTSALNIPTLQVGFPGKTSARLSDLVLTSKGNQFSFSQSQSNGNATATITPNQPTLNPGANVTVGLEGVITGILNLTSGSFSTSDPALILYSPSLNVNVSRIKSNILLPAGADFLTTPAGFSYSPTNGTYFMSQQAIRPVASEGYATFNSTSQASFTPMEVTSLVRTIVPSANGSPTVVERFTVHNLASYNVTQIHLNLLNRGISSVTELPSTEPPLLNPKVITLSSGNLVFAEANIGSSLFPKSNLTVTFSYPLPSSMMAVSGNTVKVTMPYTPLIAMPVSNYSIILAHEAGIVTSGPTSVLQQSVTPFTQGTVQFTYTVSVGWAADQAIPAGILVFAVAFAMFAVQRPSAKAQEGEKAVGKIADVLRAFEEKTGLETQYMGEFAFAQKGSIGRADFDRMRNEVNELRSRAIQRLNEMKQVLGSGRQFDALTKVAEGEKEEDRAFSDLLNLYTQYHGSRMNEETFKRLLPNYKKRVDSAINQLSDLLHAAQIEEK